MEVDPTPAVRDKKRFEVKKVGNNIVVAQCIVKTTFTIYAHTHTHTHTHTLSLSLSLSLSLMPIVECSCPLGVG